MSIMNNDFHTWNVFKEEVEKALFQPLTHRWSCWPEATHNGSSSLPGRSHLTVCKSTNYYLHSSPVFSLYIFILTITLLIFIRSQSHCFFTMRMGTIKFWITSSKTSTTSVILLEATKTISTGISTMTCIHVLSINMSNYTQKYYIFII